MILVGQVVTEDDDLPVVIGESHRAVGRRDAGQLRIVGDIDELWALVTDAETSQPLPAGRSEGRAICTRLRVMLIRRLLDLVTRDVVTIEQNPVVRNRGRIGFLPIFLMAGPSVTLFFCTISQSTARYCIGLPEKTIADIFTLGKIVTVVGAPAQLPQALRWLDLGPSARRGLRLMRDSEPWRRNHSAFLRDDPGKGHAIAAVGPGG